MLENIDFSPYIDYSTIKENGKITGIKINKVKLPEMVEQLYELVDPKNNLKDPLILQQFHILGQEQKLLLASQMLITRYCIHRVLTHHKVYQSDAWSYQVGADYYGEEIQYLQIKKSKAQEIVNVLDVLRSRNTSEKLETILKMEYGRLIPAVVKKQWYVAQISRNDLYYSNQEHYLQCVDDLQKEENTGYNEILAEYPYPRAITVLNPEGQYKVIDGYHRLVGCPSDQDQLVIYCLRDEKKTNKAG